MSKKGKKRGMVKYERIAKQKIQRGNTRGNSREAKENARTIGS